MEKRCFECMEPIGETDTCPKCGFDNKNVPQKGFKGGTFLKERYYLGNVFSKTVDSTVYIAFDNELGKKVFVREFTGEGITKISSRYTATELKQKFLNYAKSTATFNMCDLIPHTVDAFAENEECYLVTDYFEGESLKTLLKSGITISSSNALKMATQLLKGLEPIHKSGFVFGAISPETLYILKNGEVRIFGLTSRFYDFLEDIESRVELLNPSYSAPELFEENSKIDSYSDVYSVAAILYRVLTNKIPAISFLRSGGENLRPSRKINKKIPKNISIALLNALNWQIESRTATTGEFLAELSSKKVKRVRSKAIIWANFLGFFQRIYDSFAGGEDKKRGFLWLWITIPIILIGVLIVVLFFVIPKESESDKTSSLDSVQSDDGWYYGDGEETDVSSNDYVYGDYEEDRDSSRPDNKNSSKPTSSKKPTSTDKDGFPELEGFTLEEAKGKIAEWKCKLGKITYQSSSDQFSNHVIDQSIKAGTFPKEGTVVDLIVCKNPELPEVSGLLMKRAEEKIKEAGFENIEFEFVLSDEAPGTVVEAYFADETKKDKVIVVVSGEKLEVTAGATVADVKAKYPGVNFVFKDTAGNEISNISDTDTAKYIISNQGLPEDLYVYDGVTVTLTVEQQGAE